MRKEKAEKRKIRKFTQNNAHKKVTIIVNNKNNNYF